MTGHIRRRGENSWEIKFDLGTDPSTGKRLTRYHSFKGTKRKAEAELIRLQASAQQGDYIEPSKLTVEEFLTKWKADWARSNLGAKSFESYGQLIATHVTPNLGARPIQKLKAADIASFYALLSQSGKRARKKDGANSGLAPRSIGYIHRILHRAFGHAVRWGHISSNPFTLVDIPRARDSEIEILSEDQVRTVLTKLRGRSIYLIAALGLATGMRRGELLGLRWRDIDLDGGRLQVHQALEQTKAGIRFKSPKTKTSRRSITLPASILIDLRAHRAKYAEQRLALGLGKVEPDALVFQRPDGSPMNPNSLSTEWRRLVRTLKLPKVSLHAWRHTHASQLIASGMDVLTISRRLGHAKPSITLNVYGHLFSTSDDRAADVFEKAYGRTLTE